jgi:ferric-dicitrate binding protein FerR (iron transport regulator)
MHSKIDLPDGSTVWLNSGSKLKYPLAFDGKERNVSLSGEAFFKVHADKSHPFIVATQGLDVTATGTQFNVEAYASDTITAITLVEGKVDVDMSGIIKEKLKPNQRLVLNSITNNYKLTETDAQHWGMWKDGILAFRDEPLEEVFKRIGRNFNVDIKVKDPVVGKQLYRATFERESFEEILRLLKMTSPIQYKRIGRVRQPDNEYTKERIEVYKAN